MNNLRVGSMFAGIGGICTGFKQAECTLVWANEFDSAASKTYRYNFGDDYLVEKDIRKLHKNIIPPIDILTAGFPCQPFSIAGFQRGFDDVRGNLFFEIAKVIDKQRPRVVFLENVQNLIEHDNGKTFLVIYTTLAQFNYSVRYKTMFANEYGNSPQTRNRIYIVAFLDLDSGDRFKFPEPIPLSKTIDDIIDRSERKHDIYYYDKTTSYAQLSQVVIDMKSIYRITDRGIVKVKNNMCPTLTANMGTYKDRVPIVKDKFSIRKLTLRECLDFQGFPKEFKFPNTIEVTDAYKQIGNSVCVPVIKRIAEEIVKVIL